MPSQSSMVRLKRLIGHRRKEHAVRTLEGVLVAHRHPQGTFRSADSTADARARSKSRVRLFYRRSHWTSAYRTIAVPGNRPSPAARTTHHRTPGTSIAAPTVCEVAREHPNQQTAFSSFSAPGTS